MGWWVNHYVEFERFQNKENKLVLGLTEIPGEGEEPRRVKVFANHNVRVPTRILHKTQADHLRMNIASDPDLRDYPIARKDIDGKYSVLTIDLPNDHRILKKLGSEFQDGNYDLMLRLGGFFPDRKVVLSPDLEERFRDNEEVELDSLEGMSFGDFPSPDELKSLPYVIIDIEKPLWKKKEVKELLEEREKLLKAEKKYERIAEAKRTLDDIAGHEARVAEIGGLEERLTLKGVPDVEFKGIKGRIPLYDEMFDAEISYVATYWKTNEGEFKEVFVIDPRNEFKLEELKGYTVLKFRDERSLLKAITESIHKRKPVVSFGHNQVYDITQLRFAADEEKLVFDPAVKDVEPRRDFVRHFLQRLRQDMIYLDTMCLAGIMMPFLRQRSLGTSLKLEGVCQAMGIDFKKGLTHEQLRDVELRRLAGSTPEIRLAAANDLCGYVTSDLDATQALVNSLVEMSETATRNLPALARSKRAVSEHAQEHAPGFSPAVLDKFDVWTFLSRMKRVLPFCTYTQIAFSPNCADKSHDFDNFRKKGNIMYHGYGQKERLNDVIEFTTELPGMKRAMLEWAKISGAKKGRYMDVRELYLPLEEWLRGFAFSICPEMRQAYDETKGNPEQHLAFLQYLRAFMKAPLTDYYIARRERREYLASIKAAEIEEPDARKKFSKIEEIVEAKTLNSLLGSFRYMKDFHRSTHEALGREGRALIRPTKSNLGSLSIPPAMADDAGLFLLRARYNQIHEMLDHDKQKVLDSFMSNFERFENLSEGIARVVSGQIPEFSTSILQAYTKYRRSDPEVRRFLGRYRSSVDDVRGMIARGYRNLGEQLKAAKVDVIDISNSGDYLFVKGADRVPCAIEVRQIPVYDVE